MTTFTNPADVLRFLRAGRAVITLQSERTGAHYTYKIVHKEADAPFFVNLLTGPDNGDDFTYVGLLGDDAVRLTKKSKLSCDAPSIKAINYALRNLAAGRMPPECVIRHEGKCGVCARTLTVPESIDRGIGPECWDKMS